MIGLSVEAEDGQTELFGKQVSDLQTDLDVGNDAITGTLKYVTGYTGFSGNPDLQKGNFIALKVTAETGTTVQMKLENGESDWVTLDSDMNIVMRIADKDTQRVLVKASKDGVTVTDSFGLSGMTVETE